MSLDFMLKVPGLVEVASENITHNLNKMAEAAGIYKVLWRPDENGYQLAGDIIPVLEEGLAKLKADPSFYKQFDSPNGWGIYDHFVPFVERVLEHCKGNPEAIIVVSR
jgi:hypothetical protein